MAAATTMTDLDDLAQIFARLIHVEKKAGVSTSSSAHGTAGFFEVLASMLEDESEKQSLVEVARRLDAVLTKLDAPTVISSPNIATSVSHQAERPTMPQPPPTSTNISLVNMLLQAPAVNMTPGVPTITTTTTQQTPAEPPASQASKLTPIAPAIKAPSSPATIKPTTPSPPRSPASAGGNNGMFPVGSPFFAKEVMTAYKNMNSAESQNDYFVSTFCGQPNSSEFVVKSQGRGGLKRVVQVLSSEDCQSGVAVALFRVTAVDERGTAVSTRTKIVHVIFTGPKTAVMQRGKVASYNKAFKDPFPGFQLAIQTDNAMADLTQQSIEKSLRASGGAHQPTSFDFTNGLGDVINEGVEESAPQVEFQPIATIDSHVDSPTAIETQPPPTTTITPAVSPSAAPRSPVPTSPVLGYGAVGGSPSSSMARSANNSSDGLVVPSSCLDAFQELKIRQKYRYLIFRIEPADFTLHLEKSGTPDKTLKDFLDALSPTECRYCVYDHLATTAGEMGRRAEYGVKGVPKAYLINWAPTPASTTQKMLYATERKTVASLMKGVEDISVVKRDDILKGIGFKGKFDHSAADSDDEEQGEWMED